MDSQEFLLTAGLDRQTLDRVQASLDKLVLHIGRLDELPLIICALDGDRARLAALLEGAVGLDLPGTDQSVYFSPHSGFKIDKAGSQSGPITSLMAIERQNPGLSERLWSEGRNTQSGLQIAVAFERFCSPRSLPERVDVETVRPFLSLLFERFLYASALASMVLDALRGATQPGRRGDRQTIKIRRLYWVMATLAGRLSLAASFGSKAQWLVDMSDTLGWEPWTPSFPLLRERSLWLSAIGAQVAASYGSGVTDRYLTRLNGSATPIQFFDAAFGLVSIGTAEPNNGDVIVKELLKFSLGSGDHAIDPHLRAEVIASAIFALEHPDRCSDDTLLRLSWSGDNSRGLATAAALSKDVLQQTVQRHFLAMFGISTALRTDLSHFFPLNQATSASRTIGLNDENIADHLRAALSDLDFPTRPMDS
jgi:hypothetical protein